MDVPKSLLARPGATSVLISCRVPQPPVGISSPGLWSRSFAVPLPAEHTHAFSSHMI